MPRRILTLFAAGAMAASFAVALTAPAAQAANGTRLIPSAGTTTLRARDAGSGALQQPEIRAAEADAGDPVVDRPRPEFAGKLFPRRTLDAPVVGSRRLDAAQPRLGLSFAGLNHRDQRTANGGNQFSVEPPDQALCSGGGFVLESVNDVLRVFTTSGAPLTGVVDLNTFYGYPAAINRTTGVQGPFVTDPVCFYDSVAQRFYHVVLTLDVDPATGDFTGKNHLDVAVSNTASPTGTWTIYRIPAQDDGTDGTPVHFNCPCLGDYPHIGADANGIFVTVNQYSFFGTTYNGAQIYAFSRRAAATTPAALRVTQIENTNLFGSPGFTVWPATSPAGEESAAAGGTEFFLSTIAGDGSETGNPTGSARKLGLWAVSNTRSLDSATPALRLSNKLVGSETYVVPPRADQKAGDFPLGQCINDTTLATPFGPGCWQFLFVDEPAHTEVVSHPDANDSRMQQVVFVHGMLWGAADTAVNVRGQIKAGIAWFALRPAVNANGQVTGGVRKQGYLALAGNNLTYPSLAIAPNGRGAMAFSVMGADHHPSAGYVLWNEATGPAGNLHLAAAGRGVDDGFTSYKAFVGDPPRTRWGDYGAAWVDGSDVWLASEYVAQTCTLAQYVTAPFGSCGGTRTALANWATRVSKVTP